MWVIEPMMLFVLMAMNYDARVVGEGGNLGFTQLGTY